jgi:rubredoxin
MHQTTHFFDLGYGWLCKHCSAADAERSNQPQRARSFFSHNEPEKKEPRPLGPPLASWTDSDRNALFCPRCGIAEML